MNSNYAVKVNEEIDKLSNAGFIYPVDRTEWLSPIVIIPKKNGKLIVCMQYQKLNGMTKSNPFPLLFMEEILEMVVEHEMLSLLDRFNGYNQRKVVPKDQPKTCFIAE